MGKTPRARLHEAILHWLSHAYEASNGHRVAIITIPYQGHIATNFPVDKIIKIVSSQPKAL
jgi:hypothetical protein